MAFTESTIYAKVSVIFHILAFFFLLIGFATASWIDSHGGNAGLFQGCSDFVGCFSVDSGTATDWFRASMAFAILGFLFGLTSVVVVLVYVICISFNKVVNMVLIILDCVSIICVFTAVVVYGARYDERWSRVLYSLGYSFALVCLSFIIHLGGLVCIILDRVIDTTQNHRNDPVA